MDKTEINKAQTPIVIFVILACSLLLRLYNLNAYDLWFDELGTNMFSSASLSRMTELSNKPLSSIMVDKIKNDPHSPLYYVFVYAYSILLGDGKSLRMISVIFSMLSLGVFYKLSHLLFNRRVSLYALSLMAFNPFHLWYAQEARVYPMACFFSLLTIYIYLKALQTDSSRYWFCLPLVSILAVYSSYYFFLLFLALGIMLFLKIHRHKTARWFLSWLIISISLVLMRFFLANQVDFVKNDFWLPIPTLYTVLFTGNIFALGYSATAMHYWLGFGLFSFLLVWGALSCYRNKRMEAFLFLPILFLPILTIYIFSKFFVPLYIHRQLIIFSPLYYLFIAQGIASIRHNRIRILVIACSTILVTLSLVNYHRGFVFDHPQRPMLLTGTFPKKNYSDLISYLDKEFKEGDLIAAADLQSYMIVFSYITHQHTQSSRIGLQHFRFFSYPEFLSPFEKRFWHIKQFIESIPEDKRGNLYSFHPLYNGQLEFQEIGIAQNQINRLWLISASWYHDDFVSANSYQVNYYMTTNFEKILVKEKNGVKLELFVKKEGSP